MFVYHQGPATAYLLLYVDDIIQTASSPALLQQITARLGTEFALKDLGDLHFFLGIEVRKHEDGLHLSQEKYARRAGLQGCKPSLTPLSSTEKLSLTEGERLSPENGTKYRSLVGALQYLTLTRPDIFLLLTKYVSFFMHLPLFT